MPGCLNVTHNEVDCSHLPPTEQCEACRPWSLTVYVAMRVDIAPDVRIDAGGGELGWTTILGVRLTRETATEVARIDSDTLMEEIEKEQDTFEEMVDSHEYNYRYVIAETKVQ